MAEFRIHAHDKDGKRRLFVYDNIISTLQHEDGTAVDVHPITPASYADAVAATPISKDRPGRKAAPVTLKIQMGLMCNYECEYCSQRFVPRAETGGGQNKVDSFIALLDLADTSKVQRVEFWGGEPLVYWKTLKPLAEAIRVRLPNAHFYTITNGSLLDEEKNAWFERMGFSVAISHDGPGQCVRGPDPFDDPKVLAAIRDLHRRLHGKGRMSFNSMVHAKNQSRPAIIEYLRERFGEDIAIGEGTFIDPYDEGGLSLSLEDTHDAVLHTQRALRDLMEYPHMGNMGINPMKVIDLIDSIANHRPAAVLDQKCNMDRDDQLAVDLDGAVLTCQNVSRATTAQNGKSHHIGHIGFLPQVEMRTSTHWSQRDECPKCPVLQVCKGGCMMLDGAMFETGCRNQFADNMAYFAAAFTHMTGCMIRYVEGPQRPDRKDVFGLVMGVPAKSPKRKTIPIKAL